jgi:diguanylate cyclase (GGDEF)-like protein
MSWGTKHGDDLVPVADRIRWMQLCRALMLVALPVLAAVSDDTGAGVRELTMLCAVWLAVGLASWAVVRVGRWAAVATLTVTLLGDGVILAFAWYRFGDLDGPVGMVIMLHAIAVTLVATFRTGGKVALWHSLLALVVLDAKAVGLAGPVVPFPVKDVSLYLFGLWAAVLGTACLAAANERELRRRRHDERVLRELALALSAESSTAYVAGRLARFGFDELLARRAAVVVFTPDASTDELGPTGLAAVIDVDGTPTVQQVPTHVDRPNLAADVVALRHQPDPDTELWLTTVLPDARNVIVVPIVVAQATGALVLEQRRHWSQRYSRRVERRLIATARQAAAQSAMAIGRTIAAAKLAAAVNVDGLTGLANRGRFDAALSERITNGDTFALILVDLDHFKSVNDTYGHQAGDAVLRAVAVALRAAVGPGDLVARYGGEELVILTIGGPYEAELMAERLRTAVAYADTPVSVTASLGAACHPAEESTAEGLIELADQRLYVAKRTGRDRAVTSATGWPVGPGLPHPALPRADMTPDSAHR